jgi:hypothetical protein
MLAVIIAAVPASEVSAQSMEGENQSPATP